MKLRNTSFTAKVYLWFYGTKILPKNFCPYFWKSVIAYIVSTIFIIPIVFGKIYHLVDEKAPNFCIVQILTGILTMITIGVIFALMFPILDFIGLINVNYNDEYINSWIDFIGRLGITFWGFIILIGIFYLICSGCTKTYHYFRYTKPSNQIIKQKKNYLLIEYIKAFYHKHCPIIEWVD